MTATTNYSTTGTSIRMLAIATASLCVLFPDLAMAFPWDDAADKVLTAMTGRMLTVAAIIAVMVVGVLSLTGRMPWGRGMAVIGGIVIVFSAPYIVNYIRT